jgi:hypothetical protein
VHEGIIWDRVPLLDRLVQPKGKPNQPRDPGGEHGGQWISGGGAGGASADLTDEAVREELGAYQQHPSPPVNRVLRGVTPAADEPDHKKVLAQMDKAMDNAGPIGKPTRVYRVGDWSKMNLPYKPFMSELEGQTLTDPGFASTSSDVNVAKDFLDFSDKPILITMDIDPAVKVVDMNKVVGDRGFEAQQEMLIERGARMVVVSSLGGVDHALLKVKVLPPL